MWNIYYALTFKISPLFVFRILYYTMQYLSVIFSNLTWCMHRTRKPKELHQQEKFPLPNITYLINVYPFFVHPHLLQGFFFSVFCIFFPPFQAVQHTSRHALSAKPCVNSHISDIHKLITDMHTINKRPWWVAWDVL